MSGISNAGRVWAVAGYRQAKNVGMRMTVEVGSTLHDLTNRRHRGYLSAFSARYISADEDALGRCSRQRLSGLALAQCVDLQPAIDLTPLQRHAIPICPYPAGVQPATAGLCSHRRVGVHAKPETCRPQTRMPAVIRFRRDSIRNSALAMHHSH